jgi:hypothetical protein
VDVLLAVTCDADDGPSHGACKDESTVLNSAAAAQRISLVETFSDRD